MGWDFFCLHLQRVLGDKDTPCSLFLSVHRLEIDDRMKIPHNVLAKIKRSNCCLQTISKYCNLITVLQW